MSVRVDTSSLIADACVLGHRGLGVLGSVIRATTATGTHGPGYLYNDLTGADDLKEIRGLIVTPPSAGTFTAFEDGSFTLVGAPDGSYSFLYRLFADGADLGTATATIDIGDFVAVTAAISGTVTGTVEAAVDVASGSADITVTAAMLGSIFGTIGAAIVIGAAPAVAGVYITALVGESRIKSILPW